MTKDTDLLPVNPNEVNTDNEEDSASSQQLINTTLYMISGNNIETSRWYPDYKYGREKDVLYEIKELMKRNSGFTLDNIYVKSDSIVGIKAVSLISSDNGWQEDIPTVELEETTEER